MLKLHFSPTHIEGTALSWGTLALSLPLAQHGYAAHQPGGPLPLQRSPCLSSMAEQVPVLLTSLPEEWECSTLRVRAFSTHVPL